MRARAALAVLSLGLLLGLALVPRAAAGPIGLSDARVGLEMAVEPSPPVARRPLTMTFTPSGQPLGGKAPSLTVFAFVRDGDADAMVAKLPAEPMREGRWRVEHTFDRARRYELRCLLGDAPAGWSPTSFQFTLVVMPEPAARWRQVLLGVSVAFMVAYILATVRKTRRARAELREGR
ncbi:MAG: hypothetical protein KC466_12735 [Myxococcales bacterium]|nr:hypothetical protein [Myxococcales bacterium]